MAILQTLIKQPAESRVYEMKFGALLALGETIASMISFTLSPDVVGHNLVHTGPLTILSRSVTQRFSGGDAGIRYKVTIVVTTSSANIIEGEGYISVQDN